MNLPTIPGSALPPIGWQHGTEFDPAMIKPVHLDWHHKPRGGLWTSPIRDGETGWTRWCRDEGFADPEAPITPIKPDPDARVYVIDSHEDLLDLEAAYTGERVVRVWPAIDWPVLAMDVDAVWLTEAGEHRTRYTLPGLYGWDCETVYWLNPRVSRG